MHTISQKTSTKQQSNNQSLVAASSYCVSPDRVRQQHPAGLAPTPTYPHRPPKGKAEPRDVEGMFGARGTKQRQAARRGFRSNSPTQRNFWSQEEREKRLKEMAEWERNPGKDEVFAALTQTGEKKATADQEEEEDERSGKQQGDEGGKEEANKTGGRNPGFSFLGKKERKED